MAIVDLGVITAERLINDEVLQKAIAAEVRERAQAEANLLNEAVISRADMHGDLELVIPGIDAASVHEDVGEGQVVSLTNAKMTSKTLELKKHTGVIALTDEAVIRSGAHGINAIDLQMRQIEYGLANLIDKQIVGALNETPQTGTKITFSSGNIYDTLAEAEEKIEKDITAIVCSPQCRTKIFSNVNKVAYTGSTPSNPHVGTILPGANLPIIASRAVTTDYMYFVSSKLDAVIFGEGAPIRRVWDDAAAGTTNMRIDNFTGALSNYWQTASNQSAAVVKTEWE